MEKLILYKEFVGPEMFYSQSQEDYHLFTKYLNYRNGFFIELGAMDGVCYSNSLFFEKFLGWSGILIEPSDCFFDLIKNRPNAKNYKFIISEKQGAVEFIGSKSGGHLAPMAGTKESLSESVLQEFQKYNQGNPDYIESVPIRKLLNGVKKVDLFSIDVEGGEYEVLTTFDWNIPVYIILLEDNQRPEIMNKCRELLIEKGFTLEGPLAHNEVWINKNFKHD